MSLFNKPKRNIRRRPFNEDDEDNENRMDSNEDSQSSKFKPKKKDKPKQTLLSFGEELDEGSLKKQTFFFSFLSNFPSIPIPTL